MLSPEFLCIVSKILRNGSNQIAIPHLSQQRENPCVGTVGNYNSPDAVPG